jgi:hypothetical protein
MKREPKFYKKPEKNKLLFIGLNPDFSIKQKHNYLIKPLNFRANRKADIPLTKSNFDIEQYSPKYFSFLQEISEKISQNGFEYCDIFLMKESNSRIVEKLVSNDHTNPFVKEQLEILTQFIKDAKPELIIIPNAVASRIYKRTYLNKQDLKKQNGCYFTEMGERKIPTFLCGSWQYGRLDEFTMEMIVFHIKKTLELSHSELQLH